MPLQKGTPMQPEGPQQQAQPGRQPRPAPTPQPSPIVRSAPAAKGQSRLTKLIVATLFVGVLACGAVATVLMHVPGFDFGTSAPQATSVTQTNAEQSSE